MLDLLFAFVFFAATMYLMGLSARSDWRGMIIPNEYALALVGVFALGFILPNSIFSGVTFMSGLIAGAIVFTFTIALYAAKAMGGGDTKLASAVALLVGTKYLGVFLLVMAFTGGFLAVYALLTRKHGDKLLPSSPPEGTWLARLKAGENKIPYGIAIAVGACVALFQKWLMPVFSGVS
jgi:prepilin peptidase CpaA